MNTGNMPEDELDDLFRKSASEIHPEFDPMAWQAMEKKLDAHKIRRIFWKRMGGLTALLLLLGTIFWFSQRSGEKKEINIATTSQSQTLPSQEVVPDVKPKADLSLLASGGDQKGLSAVAPADSPQSNPEQEKAITPGKVKVKVPREIRNKQIIKVVAEAKDNRSVKQMQAETGNADSNTTTDSSATKSEITDKQVHGNLPVPVAKGRNQADTSSTKPKIQTPIDSAAVVSQLIKSDNTGKSKENKTGFINRIGISLLFAPDLSSVGFANPGGISTNAGILVSYQLADRWSLSSGIIRARKIYQAKSEDYEVKYWPGGYTPEYISAVCGVLDIPINIGFKIMQKEKSTVTINTGLSSYIMRYEKYDYDYGHYGKTTYEFSNQNQHLFSTYNLSAGYNRQLNRSIAIGAEPFVKIPLAGVGAGKVKLASAGIFFSVSYRYPR